jgi:hypothetical protein
MLLDAPPVPFVSDVLGLEGLICDGLPAAELLGEPGFCPLLAEVPGLPPFGKGVKLPP